MSKTASTYKILIIEDDSTFSSILGKFLEKNSFSVCAVTTVNEGLKAIISRKFDLLLLDYRLPDGTGLDLLENESFRSTRLPVIIMTTFNDIRIAVRSMKMGAKDYITKPVHPDELLMSIREVLSENEMEAGTDQRIICLNGWIKGESDVAKQMQGHVELVAPTEMSVLVQGESGTGKEFVARSIHQLSQRAGSSFIAVDCGALTSELAASELFGHVRGAFTHAIQDKKGHFEMASGGTLFLDEIGNLTYENQIKLLRAIQEKTIQPIGSSERKQVDVRLITATNEDLYKQVKDGKFREDLYHRINEFKIHVPPLRDRHNDLDLFISHFVEEANKNLNKRVSGFTKSVLKIFHQYGWPGNLRELKNTVKRAVLLANMPYADTNCLPDEMLYSLNDEPKADSQTDLKSIQKSNEKILIIHALEKVKHNKTKAARLLNIDRKTLYNKLSQYNIS